MIELPEAVAIAGQIDEWLKGRRIGSALRVEKISFLGGASYFCPRCEA